MTRDVGDILDRFSIARLKKERIGTPETLQEYAAYTAGYLGLQKEFPYEHDILEALLTKLTAINAEIWDLESAVRRRQLDGDIPEVGRRAIMIREMNARRINVCNTANKHFGEGMQNVKKYHVSEHAAGKDGTDKA